MLEFRFFLNLQWPAVYCVYFCVGVLGLTSPTKDVRIMPTRTTTLSSGVRAGRTLRLYLEKRLFIRVFSDSVAPVIHIDRGQL